VRKLCALLLATGLCMAPSLAMAADIAAEVRARLAESAVVRGKFEQRKIVVGFSKPLVSSGDFLVWRGHGVLWQTRKPFDAQLVLTRDRLVARTADTTYQINAGTEPALRVTNQLLFAVLAGDVGSLQQHFRVTGELDGKDAWRVALVPIDGGIGRFLKRVEIDGDSYVRHVRIDETNGDSSAIRFDALSEAPPPTPEEVKRLAE
jgi:Outer membrane lipoprotein carrier protein LolA